MLRLSPHKFAPHRTFGPVATAKAGNDNSLTCPAEESRQSARRQEHPREQPVLDRASAAGYETAVPSASPEVLHRELRSGSWGQSHLHGHSRFQEPRWMNHGAD